MRVQSDVVSGTLLLGQYFEPNYKDLTAFLQSGRSLSNMMERNDLNESTHGRRDTAKAQGKMGPGKPFLSLAVTMAQRKAMHLVSTTVNIVE